MNLARILTIVWICKIAVASGKELELEFRNDLNKALQKQLDNAKPGDLIEVLPGTYYGTLHILEGVSLYGKNPEQCKIIGDVFVERKFVKAQTNIQGLTLYSSGGISDPGVKLSSVKVKMQNCIIARKGGFSVISSLSGSELTIKNSIIVGPQYGGYTIFSRGGGKVSIINCTVVSRAGNGVTLMDDAKADIRACLFFGKKPAVFTMDASFTVSHSNFSLSGGGLYFRNEPSRSKNNTLKEASSSGDEKNKGEGLTFRSDTYPKELSVSAFRLLNPEFAKNSGSPSENGIPRGIGAFGGNHLSWDTIIPLKTNAGVTIPID